MKHIEVAKAAMDAGFRVNAELYDGDAMRVNSFDDEGFVVGKIVRGPLEHVLSDAEVSRHINNIVAYTIIL